MCLDIGKIHIFTPVKQRLNKQLTQNPGYNKLFGLGN